MAYDNTLYLRNTGPASFGLFSEKGGMLHEWHRVTLLEAERYANNYISSWSSVQVVVEAK
jgi:hypothetical protein